jgi:hypothetical protein
MTDSAAESLARELDEQRRVGFDWRLGDLLTRAAAMLRAQERKMGDAHRAGAAQRDRVLDGIVSTVLRTLTTPSETGLQLTGVDGIAAVIATARTEAARDMREAAKNAVWTAGGGLGDLGPVINAIHSLPLPDSKP